MRILLSLVILLAAAIGLAVGARFNPGNVVFFYPPYRVDLSLNLFIVLTAILFAILFGMLNALRSAQQMPQRVAAYRRDKREREGNRAMREALPSELVGTVLDAGLAALIAARAAHRIGRPERRDTWLAKVRDDATLKTARLMISIELALDGQQYDDALEAARELNASGTRHIHALRLALKANQRARNWPEVLRLVRLLDKRNAVHPVLSRRLRELAYDDLLSTQAQDVESIQRVWASVPPEDRVRPFVAVRAARIFNAKGLYDEARSVVEKALAVEWDDRLVRAYRESAAAEGSASLLAQIERCEEWMATRPGDPELALTLGSLCLRQKLWGKAQRCLEQALSDASNSDTVREAHLKLAQLHEALNLPEEAAAHYRMCALSALL